MIEERSWAVKVFDVCNHVFLVLVALVCLVPLVHLLAVSLSGKAPSQGYLVRLWPIEFNTANYQRVLIQAQFRRSFMVSLERTVFGTALNLFIVAFTAYPLSVAEGFRGQRVAKWLLIFGMLFSGGLIPTYLAIRSLGLLDKIWALILPGAVPIWSVIILLNFFRQLPGELAEAASIDGASHWVILFRIYLPVSLPAVATLTLFAAVGHWNSWFDGLIYMVKPDNYPLQTYVRNIIVSVGQAEGLISPDENIFSKISWRSIQAAQVLLTALPILLLYPFLQRYFMTGLTLGSVKG